MEWYLPLAWGLIIGAAVAMYVVLDGFDLGIGILFPFTKNEHERDQMMNTVAPFWDGNETWLVLGGGGLWVAFPKAYAVVMPALYLPVIVMLLALIFRGVSFEFRWVAKPNKGVWNVAFAGGSIVAAFCQGLILGGLLQGIDAQVVPGRGVQFAGGALDWLTPFSLLCGVGVTLGYALLGATWLNMKTDGEVARRSRAQAVPLLAATLVAMALVSLWTPFAIDRIWERWFSWPNIGLLWPIPLVTAAVAWGVWKGLENEREIGPFLGSIALFFLGFLGLAISIWPYLVPPTLTFWDAAAAPASQIFMAAGTIVLFPIIIGYTVFVYWLFRGKVREGEGYH
ncbi:cytochrome d ubiquinol oxidase subunit II [Methylopila turkensis]|uniref:Ubiquinol oxidase subunit II, cyanide insensitive n=1 Tax=Methylopila turkensis TaxID=1437816 RepID=A0A9W6JLJ3_9HYPH|nr:cytochrome d ubiquinol oxidase subunit II [Methylopila turkensis]GLK79312.1 ubiquinol oxidase subunit II, cyanide insensitive [Methylopila turkensis]